jgi:CRISPR/Cas system CSM-associated protein Csm3 (group 7 of RAMP superfamily)
MTGSTVHVTAHGPLRIATGHAGRGLDALVDRDRVPASSLKGVMRAAAAQLLGLPPGVVERLFGSPSVPSPWAWTDVDLNSEGVSAHVASRVRVAIDSATGTVREGALMHAEELWIGGDPTFRIEQTGEVADADQDGRLLAAIARAVPSIGASRRRGLGWVSLRPVLDVTGTELTAEQAAELVVSARASGGQER